MLQALIKSFALTPLGWTWIPLVLLALFFRPRWLLSLLIFSAVLHFPAVATLVPPGTTRPFGVSPWLFTAAACAFYGGLELCRVLISTPGFTGALYFFRNGWVYFFVFGALTAALLPFVFEGVEVYWLGNAYGFDEPLSQLKWSFTNATMMVNALLLAALVVYVRLEARDSEVIRRIAVGMGLAIAVSILLAFTQRLIFEGVIAEIPWLERSANPGYSYGHGSIAGIQRVAWPFSEPSYASVWFASVSLAGLAMGLISDRRVLGLSIAAAGFAGLINTLGATGMLAVVVTIFVLFLIVAVCSFCRPANPIHTWSLRWMRTVACAALTGGLLFKFFIFTEPSFVAVWEELHWKLTSSIDPNADRMRSVIHAGAVLVETYGMGVGLGSNRASSYIASLASNVGIVGATWFILLMFRYAVDLFRLASAGSILFFLGGTLGCLAGIVVGIPDFAWPGWWIWLLSGMALAGAKATDPPTSPRFQ